MLPNDKKTLSQLKADFSEGQPGRITPKLLRDFLVSVMGNRMVSTVDDSQHLTEDHDLVVLGFDMGGNYLTLPKASADDLSGTPMEFKFYTVVNPTSYPARVVTDPDERFHDGGQEIVLNPTAVANLFAFGGEWWYFLAGNIPGKIDAVGFPRKVETEIPSGGDTVADRVAITNKCVKWVVHFESASGASRSCEILANIRPGEVSHSEASIVGDDLPRVDIDVVIDGVEVQLLVTNMSGEMVNSIVMRTVVS